MATAVTISPSPILSFFDNRGLPCVGGTVLTQVGGVNTTTYQDAAGTIPLPNPIPLNNRGEISNSVGATCQLFLQNGIVYTFTLFDANGNQLNQAAYVTTSVSAAGLASTTSGSQGAGLVGFNPNLNYVVDTSGAAIEDGWINALWFCTSEAQRQAIKTRAFTIDCTAVAQAALTFAGPGSTVLFPGGWYINGTLTGYAGQTVRGMGWSTTTNAFTVVSGSEFRQFSTSNVNCLQFPGADNNHQLERWGLYDMALTSSVPSSTVGTGFYAAYGRQGQMRNVYIAGFNTAMNFDPQCWQMLIEGVRCMDFAVGMVNNSTSEDNCFISCQWAGYRTGSVGVSLANQSANNVFINCYLQALQNGCLMAQGDTHGDGTGTPFPMFTTWISPLIEDITQFAFGLVTSAQTAVSGLHPGIRVINPRVLNTGLSGYQCSNTPSTSASGSGTTATIGFAAQPVAPLVGTVVTLTGIAPSGYNGSFVITGSTTTSVSFASTTTGAQTTAGTVIYGTTTFNAAPNNGQSIIYATHCSELVLEQPMEGGFSFGVNAGVNGYGYFPTGTLPGPIALRDLNGYTFGTAPTNGKTGSVSIIPGDAPNGRFNTTASTLSVTSQFANPTWDQAVSNYWGWADTTMSRFTPSRAQTVRFTCNIQLAATVNGGTYALQMSKNGSTNLGIRGETTANGTGPVTLSGQWYDVANGSTDFYKVQIFVSTGASITLTPASCDFNAELVGT